MKTYRSTFRQQITLTVGLLSLALVLATAIGAATIGRRQAVHLISDEMAELAANMARALDRRMFERFREVKNIAALAPLQPEWTAPPERTRTILNQLQATLPEYAWIGFATPDGIVRSATGGTLEGQSVAARPWFNNGFVAPAIGDVHEAQLLASMRGRPANDEPPRFVDIAAPVKGADGALIGVLGAHLNWAWAEETRGKFLSASQLGDGTEIWVLSASGAVLLGPALGSRPFSADRLKAIRAAKRGAFQAGGGDAVLTGFAATVGNRDYPGLGWIVVARRPASVAFAQADAVVSGIALMGLLLAGFGMALVWALAGQLARPMGELTRVAHQIGRSPDVTMLPRLDSTREMAHLSAALRALLRRLGSAEQQAADATEHAALEARKFASEMDVLRNVADTDPLTGLANRRAFLAAAGDAMTYYQRYRRSIAVLVVDIDFFKRINDTYGHPAGDAMIRSVGDALAASVRTTDKVARFGGEEFVVLLREIGDDDAQALAERMRNAVRSSVVIDGGRDISVTVSIGGALARDGDRDIQDVIERADHALYMAKDSGRNRVVIDQAPAPQEIERIAA